MPGPTMHCADLALDAMEALDGRTKPARRWRQVVSDLVSDAGGASEVSAVRRSLILRFAAASTLAEQMEQDALQGRKVDLAEFVALGGLVNRIASRLGLSRRARKIETLEDIVAAHHQPSDDDGETES